ncbi:MAG: cell envelope integrity protein TolA [Pseudomonadota bacterium]
MIDRPRPGSWSSISLSLLLHGAVALLAVAGYFFIHKSPPRQVRLAIEATVVSAAPKQAARPVVPEPVASPPEPDPAIEQAKQEARQQQEEARQKEEAREKAEDEAAKEKAALAQATKDKAAREKAAQEKEAQEKAEKEKAEQAKADKKKAAEKAAQEKLVRDKALADQKRAQSEAELNAQIAAEEKANAVRASGQMNLYIAQITAKIERNWTRPANAQAGLNCEVRVTQVPGGTVTGVRVERCNGDESVRGSIERAVLKASPLPLPSDPALFERILVVTFRPDN